MRTTEFLAIFCLAALAGGAEAPSLTIENDLYLVEVRPPNGVITRNSKVRFLREGAVIWKGTVSSLKRFKEDAREVAAGFECGIGLSDFQDLKQGDVIETYEEREIPRS